MSVVVPLNSKQADFLEEVKPIEDEVVMSRTSSGVFAADIDQILRKLGVGYSVFVGVATNECVETSVREAADWGYKRGLVGDTCASMTQTPYVASVRVPSDVYANTRSIKEVPEERESR